MDPTEILNFEPALLEVFLFIVGLALLLVGSLSEKEGGRAVTPLAVLALIVASLLLIGVDKGPIETFGGHFIFDDFSAFLKVLILWGAAASIVLAQGYFDELRLQRFEYPILAIFASLGMCMMVSANSLLALYMGLELLSLPLYVMAAYHRDTLRSSEAGLKYFILGALASGLLLYGCSLIYGFTGTLFFDALAQHFASGPEGMAISTGALVGVIFVIAGLAFKLSAVPFHMWTPDVYEGAPTPVTAFFAAAPKVAALGLIVRVLMQPFGEWVEAWQQVIVFIAICSMVLGAFAAIGQTNFKRLMAYSSIGNVGYALVGLAAGTERGVYGVLVYIAIYLVMTVGTFACILMMRRQGRPVEGINDLAGLSKSHPMMALALAIFMFSLAGIPPLAGFFGKLYLFMAAVDAGLIVVAVIGVLASVVSAYYYLRIVKLMYFDEPVAVLEPPARVELGAIAAVTAIMIAFFIVVPGPLLDAATSAAAATRRSRRAPPAAAILRLLADAVSHRAAGAGPGGPPPCG
ncbi:MAG: NADH-quinone oxidoreductase subunit NuoN, partial [Pseudomonadota bacterium]